MKGKPVKWNSALKRFMMTILFLSMVFALAACADSKAEGDSGADGKLKVTATIGMIADVAQNIGGEHVVVESLMGPGVDPHYYKASQGDIKKLDQADIVFYNGLLLEGKMVDVFEKLSRNKTTVAVAKDVPVAKLLADPAAGVDSHDPHIWFNVQHWMKATEVIRDTLIEKDAKNADDYKRKADAYLKELQELDTYAREQIALIPDKSRVLVTAHDAFGYFGDAYGIKVVGLQGMSTASEYGSKDVSELRNFLVDNQIKAVFVESSVSTKGIEAVIEGAKQKGHAVKIGGEIFSDAMGPAGTKEGTYIGMVRHNVDTIVNALK
ncbi:metal ABC transporter solute-binding protein, Zn/Mn family [Paenibacillus sp. 481]|uniref:metal ABC transporter solute-binding protein, Zn/Mn family n=1 Tax=Paenibacillus sp. 481 TaxID=2835869 RepID=UPI001E384F2D|nr:zinc ABC transporter substrate-binding protein [Paenibacillus sp. 481]UHA74633.1 zinc ABC transporter substrate-binding protein [Paenibacillus sp. 481]